MPLFFSEQKLTLIFERWNTRVRLRTKCNPTNRNVQILRWPTVRSPAVCFSVCSPNTADQKRSRPRSNRKIDGWNTARTRSVIRRQVPCKRTICTARTAIMCPPGSRRRAISIEPQTNIYPAYLTPNPYRTHRNRPKICCLTIPLKEDSIRTPKSRALVRFF